MDAVVRIKSGETLVLAGMIMNKESTDNTGVPWLRNVPLIGALFAKNQKSLVRTELAIFITPTLMEEPEQIAAERRSTEKRLDTAGAELNPAPPPAKPELKKP
jgi:type II secretory pathway component GspD/PulD (secretin)